MRPLAVTTHQPTSRTSLTVIYPNQLNPFGSEESLSNISTDRNSVSYDETKNPFSEEDGSSEPLGPENQDGDISHSEQLHTDSLLVSPFRPTPAPRRKLPKLGNEESSATLEIAQSVKSFMKVRFGSVREPSSRPINPFRGDRPGSLRATSHDRGASDVPVSATTQVETEDMKGTERSGGPVGTSEGVSRRSAPKPPNIVLIAADEDGDRRACDTSSPLSSVTSSPRTPQRAPLTPQERTRKDHDTIKNALLLIRSPSNASPHSSPGAPNIHSTRNSPTASSTGSPSLHRKISRKSSKSSGKSQNGATTSISSLLFDAGRSFRYF